MREPEENKLNVFGIILIIVGVALAIIFIGLAYTFVYEFEKISIIKYVEKVANTIEYKEGVVSVDFTVLLGVSLLSLSIIGIAIASIIKSIIYSGALLLTKEGKLERIANEINKMKIYWSKKSNNISNKVVKLTLKAPFRYCELLRNFIATTTLPLWASLPRR